MSDELQSAATNEHDRAAVLAILESTRQQVLQAADAVSPVLQGKRTADGCWTVLECMEHIVNSEEGLLRLWQKLAEPGVADRGNDVRVRGMADRSHKRPAPERVVPQGRIKTLAEARERFVAARAATITTVEQMPAEELRGKTVQHWVFGAIDGYQLFHLTALHTARHAAQMTETAEQLAAHAGGNA